MKTTFSDSRWPQDSVILSTLAHWAEVLIAGLGRVWSPYEQLSVYYMSIFVLRMLHGCYESGLYYAEYGLLTVVHLLFLTPPFAPDFFSRIYLLLATTCPGFAGFDKWRKWKQNILENGAFYWYNTKKNFIKVSTILQLFFLLLDHL